MNLSAGLFICVYVLGFQIDAKHTHTGAAAQQQISKGEKLRLVSCIRGVDCFHLKMYTPLVLVIV